MESTLLQLMHNGCSSNKTAKDDKGPFCLLTIACCSWPNIYSRIRLMQIILEKQT